MKSNKSFFKCMFKITCSWEYPSDSADETVNACWVLRRTVELETVKEVKSYSAA